MSSKRQTKRMLFLFLASIFVAGPVQVGTAQSTDQHERPNVLFILTDDQGWGDVGAYGAEDLKTPNMDGLVQNGMKFTQFYTNSSVCSPTRASVMTGRYPDHVGVPGLNRTNDDDNWSYLNPDETLIAEPLNEAGYHTAIIGKWNLGLEKPNRPNDHGFDYFHGFLGDMMDDYWSHMRNGYNLMRRNTTKIDPEGHATELFTDWAVDYVKQQSNEERPWFLYLPYNAPHFPIQPPEKWLERVKKREEDISSKRAKLIAFIEHLDHEIGHVIDALKSSGQYEDTMIIFSSDNGGDGARGGRVGPHRGYKKDLYEGGIAVPMSVTWPGHVEPGTETDLISATIDLYPTILDAAGAKIPDNRDGVSLLPTLLGNEQNLDRHIFFVRREGGGGDWGRAHYAVRRGKWKLVQNRPFQPLELYNLEKDPREQNDVSDEHSDVFRSMSQALQKHIQEAGKVPWQPPEHR